MTKTDWLSAWDSQDVYKFLTKQLPKIASKQYKRTRRDLARLDYGPALHRVGLTQHTPVRNTLGGIGLFILGCVAGGIAALALAPMNGEELRSQVKDKAKALIPPEKASELHSSGRVQA